MQWFVARLQLLLVALIVLLASAASERSHYFCKMMGRAVAECCCARAHGQQGPNREVTGSARPADCCELMAGDQHPVAIVHHVAPPEVPIAALAPALPALEYAPPRFSLVRGVASMARAPPAIGPPLFISHCALLI